MAESNNPFSGSQIEKPLVPSVGGNCHSPLDLSAKNFFLNFPKCVLCNALIHAHVDWHREVAGGYECFRHREVGEGEFTLPEHMRNVIEPYIRWREAEAVRDVAKAYLRRYGESA